MGPVETWPAAPPATGRRSAPRTPADALVELLAGNRRFVADQPRYGHHSAGAVATASEQHPFAMVLGCIDSRVPVEAVFDQGPGAILVARSAGHVLDRAVLGSVEFAVGDFAVPLVVVLGHTRCGAVQATLNALNGHPQPDGAREYLVDQLMPAARAAGAEPTESSREHVRRTVASLNRLEPLRSRADVGALTVTGALYHLDSGRVEVL